MLSGEDEDDGMVPIIDICSQHTPINGTAIVASGQIARVVKE